MAARAGGAGIFGFLLIAGLIYFSGAGGWMLNRLQGLEPACYGMLSSLGNRGGQVCAAVGKGVSSITQLADRLGQPLDSSKNWFQAHVFSLGNINSFGSLKSSLQQAAVNLGNSGDRLNQLVRQGPQRLISGDTGLQFQRAIDNFSVGQRYAAGGNTSQALPWLQAGAAQPQGFGLLSQLSLGDLYSRGAPGIEADPLRAQQYYRSAQDSLMQLSQSNSPQAQQLLGALPSSPQNVKLQIDQAISQINRR